MLEGVPEGLEAWRTIRVGNREYVDAVVAPAHRGPSPELARALKRWPGIHYWTDREHSGLVLVRNTDGIRPERLLVHVLLALTTIVSMLGAGAALAGAWRPSLRPSSLGAVGSALGGGARFYAEVLRGGWGHLEAGVPFMVTLLAILLIHELGHYVAARRYGIDTSLPWFIPVPPTLSPIGSFGAFLRLRSPVLDRRQLLDVGASGPIAGFIAVLAALAYGYQHSVPVAAGTAVGDFVTFAGTRIGLGSSLLTWSIRELYFPGAAAVHLSLPAFAGWVGAFVTGLNMLPLTQLDGGHVHYAMFGRRQSAIGAVVLLGLILLGTRSTTWLIWAALALLIGGGRWAHPSVLAPVRAVPTRRRWIGWLAILVGILTFVPLPFAL